MEADRPETDALTRLRDLVRWGASAFARAGLVFGHGSANALDEAWHLCCHALHLPFDLPNDYLDAAVTASEREAVLSLYRQRIESRRPAAYLTGRAWFCGLEFAVDERVLVPRSPIAELIEQGFAPWLTREPTQVLDLCTGSGCIGIATAMRFPDAAVDLADIDEGALAVCADNIERHGLADRVSAHRSDGFDGLRDRCYELIVCNPPYVPLAEWQGLSEEYHHEPRIGLEAGEDGMDFVDRLVREAPDHLADDGILVCEIGAYADEFEARFPSLAVTWLEFERGGEGVFAVDRAQLMQGIP